MNPYTNEAEQHEEESLAPPPELWAEWLRNKPLAESNPNGDPYGCNCVDCVEFYRSLK